MLPVAELNDSQYQKIKNRYHQLVDKMLSGMSPADGEVIHLGTTENASQNGMDPQKIYLVQSGIVGVRLGKKNLYFHDAGDLVIPDVGAGGSSDEAITYYCDNNATLQEYTLKGFVGQIMQNPELGKLWTQLLIAQYGMCVRALATSVDETPQATPGFESFQPGDTIIQQGDRADYVYSLFEGEADVLVDDVKVGTVTEGEVIGAIAVLTGDLRSASIKANTRCSVIKVARDEFSTLIKTNPNMIHQLLTDMAKHIVSLNEQVVNLKGGLN